MTTLTSRNGTLELGPGHPVLLVSDLVRVIDQRPDVLADLQQGRLDSLLDLARFGHAQGTRAVDLLLAHYELDEVAVLPAAAKAVHETIGCPLFLDSRNPEALVAALAALRPHKAMINSVAAERAVLDTLLPIAREFGAAIVAMPTGGDLPLPMTVDGRLENAAKILDAAAGYGIPREDVVVDAICLASSAVAGSMQVTLETLEALHEELAVATILGIGNAGFGMPEPLHIDLAFLLAAVPWGLDAALVDPAMPNMQESTQAIDFLTARDEYGLAYIRRYRASQRSSRAGGRD